MTVISNQAFAADVEIAARTIKVVSRTGRLPIQPKACYVVFITKSGCTGNSCTTTSTSTATATAVKGKPGEFALTAKKMPSSEVPTTTVSVQISGVCSGAACKAEFSLAELMKSQPLVVDFDYDAKASLTTDYGPKIETADEFFAPFEAKQKAQDERMKAANAGMEWKKAKADFLANHKKAVPMTYSDVAMAKLELAPYACGANLKAKMDGCEFLNCVYTIDYPGMKIGADLIVYGYNKLGYCVMSLPTLKRYSVPKSDLPFAYEAVTANLRLDKMEGSVDTSTNGVTTSTRTIFLKDTKCPIHLTEKMTVDESNLIEATAENRKKYPTKEPSSTVGSDKSYLSKMGDTVEFKYSTTLISESLDKAAPPICKAKRIDLLYQLDLKKLAWDVIPVKFGFPEN
jgi:hypothetical protein